MPTQEKISTYNTLTCRFGTADRSWNSHLVDTLLIARGAHSRGTCKPSAITARCQVFSKILWTRYSAGTNRILVTLARFRATLILLAGWDGKAIAAAIMVIVTA